MKVPFVDLKGQYSVLKSEVLSEMARALEKMELFLGENVSAFEEEYARFCGAQFAIGVGSGTDALHLALRALEVGPGDEVITVSNTFIATVEAIALTGARPVFVDIDPQTSTIDVGQVADKITERTRALLPVHLYGQTADMAPILDLAQRHGLSVLEDACQAHGAEYAGRRAGTLGNAGCFSFYMSKNLAAYGEAGVVVTNDPEIARRVRMLRDHGSEVRYFHDVLGINSRLDELQAVVLRIKLRHLDEWNSARRRHALAYTSALKGTGLTTPVERRPGEHVYHLYVVRSTMRDRLREWLKEQGVATGIHYPVPIHLQVASKDFGCRKGDLPITETYAEEILSLPMYPELSLEQIEYVAECIRRFPGK